MQVALLEWGVDFCPDVVESGKDVTSIVAQAAAQECKAVGVLPAATLQGRSGLINLNKLKDHIHPPDESPAEWQCHCIDRIYSVVHSKRSPPL